MRLIKNEKMYLAHIPRPVRYPSDAQRDTIRKYPSTINAMQQASKIGGYSLAPMDAMSAGSRTRTVEFHFHLVLTRKEALQMLDEKKHLVCHVAGDAVMKAMHATSWALKNTPEHAYRFAFVSAIQYRGAHITGLPHETGPCGVQLLLQECAYHVQTGRLIPADKVISRDPPTWKPYLEENKAAVYATSKSTEVLPFAVKVSPSSHTCHSSATPVGVYHMPAATSALTLQYLDAAAVGLDTFVVRTEDAGCFVRAPDGLVCHDALSFLLHNMPGFVNPQQKPHLRTVAKHAFRRWQDAHDNGVPFDPTLSAVKESKDGTILDPREERVALLPVTNRQLETAYHKLQTDVLQRTRGVWDCSAGLCVAFTPFSAERWLEELNKQDEHESVELSVSLEVVYMPLATWLTPLSPFHAPAQ
jgi:hypothetical protein